MNRGQSKFRGLGKEKESRIKDAIFREWRQHGGPSSIPTTQSHHPPTVNFSKTLRGRKRIKSSGKVARMIDAYTYYLPKHTSTIIPDCQKKDTLP